MLPADPAENELVLVTFTNRASGFVTRSIMLQHQADLLLEVFAEWAPVDSQVQVTVTPCASRLQ